MGVLSVVEMLLTQALMMAMSPRCRMAGTGPWQGHIIPCILPGEGRAATHLG